MRVLDSGNRPGFLLESTNEARLVREPGVDLLHRDLAAEAGIERPPNCPEGALADPLQEPVATEGATRELQGGVLLEDAPMELLEFRRRIDAQFLGQ
jgi:hypothetical protein